MNCHICDRGLSETEVVWNKEGGKLPGTGAYEPCSTCLEAAMDAAYTDGFVRGDEEQFEELGDVDDPEVAILDGAFEGRDDRSGEQFQFSFRPNNEDNYE